MRTLAIDNSTAAALKECSARAHLRYHLGKRAVGPPSGPLLAGTYAHGVLDLYLRGATPDEALSQGAGRDEWAAYADEHLPRDDRLAVENITAILRQWMETHPRTSLPVSIDPRMVEIGFALPLTGDDCLYGHAMHDGPAAGCPAPDGVRVLFTGRLDAIGTDRQTGNLVVVEHKTTGRIDRTWLAQWRMSGQLSGYVWAAQQHLGAGQPVAGVVLNAIEFSRLPSDPVRRCRDHGVAYAECGPQHVNAVLTVVQRTPEQLEEWRRTFVMLARRWEDLTRRFPRTAHIPLVRQDGAMTPRSCTYCEFADFCAVGRPLDRLDVMLTDDPWSPYDYAMGASAD